MTILQTYFDNGTKFLKTACGWKLKIIGTNYGTTLVGTVTAKMTNGKSYSMPMEWDVNGLPLDLDKYPSRYYLRLLEK